MYACQITAKSGGMGPHHQNHSDSGVLGGRGKCATSRRMSVPRTLGRAAGPGRWAGPEECPAGHAAAHWDGGHSTPRAGPVHGADRRWTTGGRSARATSARRHVGTSARRRVGALGPRPSRTACRGLGWAEGGREGGREGGGSASKQRPARKRIGGSAGRPRPGSTGPGHRRRRSGRWAAVRLGAPAAPRSRAARPPPPCGSPRAASGARAAGRSNWSSSGSAAGPARKSSSPPRWAGPWECRYGWGSVATAGGVSLRLGECRYGWG